MAARTQLILACFLLGCGDTSAGNDELRTITNVMLDARPFESLVEYEIRDDQSVLIQAGEMPRYPLILDNAGLPPTWELVTALPSGNYKLALNARGAEFVCDGAGTISVPPRQLGVYLDCRADPTGPPPGETRALYIAGNLEVK